MSNYDNMTDDEVRQLTRFGSLAELVAHEQAKELLGDYEAVVRRAKKAVWMTWTKEQWLAVQAVAPDQVVMVWWTEYQTGAAVEYIELWDGTLSPTGSIELLDGRQLGKRLVRKGTISLPW